MNKLLYPKLLSTASFGLLLIATQAYAKTQSLKAPTLAKREQSSLQKCRKKALIDFQDKKLNKESAKKAIQLCNDQFAGASIYQDCKKNTMIQNRDQPSKLKAGLEQCRKTQQMLSFDRSQPVPLVHWQNKWFFAGINMSLTLPLDFTEPGNFSCSYLQQAASEAKSADFVVFGNRLNAFPAWQTSKPQVLKQWNAKIAKQGSYWDIKNVRLYPSSGTNSPKVFFPSGPCHLNVEPGNLFKGISVHYLIDRIGQQLVPYFAVAYYKPDQTTLTVSSIAQSARNSLGDSFHVDSKAKNYQLLTTTPVTVFDDEGDPADLCAAPRPHEIVALIHKSSDDASRPAYLLVANIKNLCEYGDRLTAQILSAKNPNVTP